MAFKAVGTNADRVDMELLAADALLLGAVIFGGWAVRDRPQRAVPIATALGAATVFALARNHYNLEESAFAWTFLAACGAAFLTTMVGLLLLRDGLRRALQYGIVAALLLPGMFIGYIVVLLTSCLFTGCGLD